MPHTMRVSTPGVWLQRQLEGIARRLASAGKLARGKGQGDVAGAIECLLPKAMAIEKAFAAAACQMDGDAPWRLSDQVAELSREVASVSKLARSRREGEIAGTLVSCWKHAEPLAKAIREAGYRMQGEASAVGSESVHFQEPPPPAAMVDRSQLLGELRRFTERFGTANGAAWLAAGKTFAEALELHCQTLCEQIAARDRSIADLGVKLAAVRYWQEGEPAPEPIAQPNEQARRQLAELSEKIGPRRARFAAGLKLPPNHPARVQR